MSEQWRPIAGYEGLYEVSDQGQVRRSAPGKGTRVGKVLCPQRHPRGYRMVALSCQGKQRYYLIHRLVSEAFLGPIPDDREVNHRNGHKADNRLVNLEYVTQSGNTQHALALGLIPTGERHYRSILTGEQVQAIRASWERRECSQSQLAERYGVSRGAILGIVYGKNWKQLQMREEGATYVA